MCGIAGLVAKKEISEERKQAFVAAANLQQHRGPDHKGVFAIDNVVLIHHRLSIIDLDARSNQPFHSQSQRFSSVYNGEIYNFQSIRQQQCIVTVTKSDTEVMLEHFARLGKKAIPAWNGIFATAIYDRQQKKLHLIRDRLGVKPLYIYEDDEVVAFASEAKVILNWLNSFQIDRQGLAQYIWYGNTTGSGTMIKKLEKLKPGHHLVYECQNNKRISNSSYWSIEHDITPLAISEEDAVEMLRDKLSSAVARQLVADVPVGILLSGGVDSSAIVAYATQHASRQMDTYSIAYDYNIGGESELAKAQMIAQKFDTNHHELKVSAGDVKSIFSELVFQYDEPFADTAGIPLYQLAKACSSDKKVILQGDGGDELFAGYRRYNVLANYRFWKWASQLYRVLPQGRWLERMQRMAFVLGQPNDANLMAYYLTQDVPYKDPYQILSPQWAEEIVGENWKIDYERAEERYEGMDRVQKLLYTDTTVLLPNTYLEKVDKATMLCSVEARVPFLDNELLAFALALPAHLKVKRGKKKYLLTKALKGLIPDDILYGPKRGFDVPYKEWLRKDLYTFARDSFQNTTNPILDRAANLKLLEDHCARTADYGPLLWKSLVLNHWLDRYADKITF
jgi:asparagine synthase (glutamine-hydrolysing)